MHSASVSYLPLLQHIPYSTIRDNNPGEIQVVVSSYRSLRGTLNNWIVKTVLVMGGHIFRTAFLLFAVIVVVVSPESSSENEHTSSESAVDRPLFLRAVDAVGGALAITHQSLSGFIFSSARKALRLITDAFCMSTDEMLDAFAERVQVVIRQEIYYICLW